MTSLEVGGQGPVQPPGRTDDFSDCKFSQPQTFKHILSDTSSEIGEIGDGLQPIILSRITFIKSPQMSVPERGQTGWLPLSAERTVQCWLFVSVFSTSGPVTQPGPVARLTQAQSQTHNYTSSQKLPFFFGIFAYFVAGDPKICTIQ